MIKNLTKNLLPREKALKEGVEKLTDVEILALFIRTGNKEKTVLQLSQELIEKIGGLGNILHLKSNILREIKGIGVAKSLEIMASIELVKRIRVIEASTKTISINDPKSIYQLLIHHFQDLDRENFWVILLTEKNLVINKKKLYDGTNNQLLIDMKDIYRFALENNASKIICAHNHPSGNSRPSKTDLETTKEIIATGKKLDIFLLDHIVFGKKEIFSIVLNKKIIID